MSLWFVIADAAKARIFEQTAQGSEPLEVLDLSHPEAREPVTHLASDSPGVQATAGGPGTHGMQEKVTPREAEDQRFARSIMKEVKGALDNGKISGFYMAAPPHFLGLLRGAMDPHLSKALMGDLDKNLAGVNGNEACAAFRRLH